MATVFDRKTRTSSSGEAPLVNFHFFLARFRFKTSCFSFGGHWWESDFQSSKYTARSDLQGTFPHEKCALIWLQSWCLDCSHLWTDASRSWRQILRISGSQARVVLQRSCSSHLMKSFAWGGLRKRTEGSCRKRYCSDRWRCITWEHG